jgi:signal transduction histidine kinase
MEEQNLLREIAELKRSIVRLQATTSSEAEQARSQMLAVFDAIEEVIYVADPETYELLFVNGEFAKSWGVDSVGRKCYEVLQGRDAPCPFCTNDQIFGPNLGKTYTWEFQNELNRRWYRCVDKAISWTDGRMVRFELASDITELKRANAELEQFAYIASHDLQEPLRMVTSYLQLIERRYKGRLDADADEFINYAVDGATRMRRLIDDLLIYSRVATRGKEFAEVDLNQSLKAVLQNLELAIAESGAVIQSGSLPVVWADAAQMEQLLQNLISNAIKFRGDHAPQVVVDAVRRKTDWVCCVRDNGIGIDPADHERIFAIFQRGSSGQTYAGTGIGLAVCKRIVERHGGQIWLESTPGASTAFYVSLPMMKKGEDLRDA